METVMIKEDQIKWGTALEDKIDFLSNLLNCTNHLEDDLREISAFERLILENDLAEDKILMSKINKLEATEIDISLMIERFGKLQEFFK